LALHLQNQTLQAFVDEMNGWNSVGKVSVILDRWLQILDDLSAMWPPTVWRCETVSDRFIHNEAES
jgi:hypothetical protein